jgi:hypothetical protein
VSSKYTEAINEIPFYKADELLQSDNYAHQTGWVNFKDLVANKVDGRDDISLIILPEKLRLVNEIKELEPERKFVQLETV